MTHPKISVQNLNMAYGDYVVMRDINFDVQSGEIFLIIGGSGCGKSTLLKYLLGLLPVTHGKILYDGEKFNSATQDRKNELLKKVGVLYQSGALFSSMTLAENISLPLEEFTSLNAKDIAEIVDFKLSLVGLKGFGGFYPAQISGGMRKRAGLARAMALDPDILFFDEPSAGLDPVSSKRLDDLILQIKQSLGTTVVIVTHELDSIFSIGDRAIYLDADTKAVLECGNPKDMLEHSKNANVVRFLSRDSRNLV